MFSSSSSTASVSNPDDRRKIGLRLLIVQWGVTVIFAALALAFWFFQVVQYPKFRELAENNHQRTLALRAPRGVLYDRRGRVLVENRDSFVISLVREHTKDMDQTLTFARWRASTRPGCARSCGATAPRPATGRSR
jgi:cell division protein FtsI/penicillin-binding protein 2